MTFRLTSIDEIDDVNEAIQSDVQEADRQEAWEQHDGEHLGEVEGVKGDFVIRLNDRSVRWSNRTRAWSLVDLASSAQDALDALDLPNGLEVEALAGDDSQEAGDVVVRLKALDDDTAWDKWQSIEDALAESLEAAGFEFSGDSGGLGGPWHERGQTYVGGTYSWWRLAATTEFSTDLVGWVF